MKKADAIDADLLLDGKLVAIAKATIHEHTPAPLIMNRGLRPTLSTVKNDTRPETIFQVRVAPVNIFDVRTSNFKLWKIVLPYIATTVLPLISWKNCNRQQIASRKRRRSSPILNRSLNAEAPDKVSSRDSSIPAISDNSSGESTSRSFNSARLLMASSRRPTRTSHRGDSGRKKIKVITMKQNKGGIAKTALHCAALFSTWSIPKLIQDVRTYPRLMKAPTRQTFDPRSFAGEHSDCQIGTVALAPPTPKPSIRRPTINCGRLKAVTSRVWPTRERIVEANRC